MVDNFKQWICNRSMRRGAGKDFRDMIAKDDAFPELDCSDDGKRRGLGYLRRGGASEVMIAAYLRQWVEFDLWTKEIHFLRQSSQLGGI